MANARFNASYRGIGELLRSPELEAEMRSRADKIKDRAELIAPVGKPPDDKHPGRYKASFNVSTSRRGGDKQDRAEARVTNDAPEAFYVEFGSKKTPRYHTLLIATEAAKG